MKIEKIDISSLSRPASSVKHKEKVVKEISATDKNGLDKSIEDKLKNNRDKEIYYY